MKLDELREDPENAAENAATIDAIPADLPAGDPLPQEVRAELRALAEAGRGVYAYHAVALPEAWYIWRGDLLDERTGYRGVRLSLDEWRTWSAMDLAGGDRIGRGA